MSVPSLFLGGPMKPALAICMKIHGHEYATIFMSEKALKRFQTECCSLNSFEPTRLESPAEILGELQKARKFGCGLLLVDPPGPEISKQNAWPIAEFVRNLS